MRHRSGGTIGGSPIMDMCETAITAKKNGTQNGQDESSATTGI